jgi:hypothetical protein
MLSFVGLIEAYLLNKEEEKRRMEKSLGHSSRIQAEHLLKELSLELTLLGLVLYHLLHRDHLGLQIDLQTIYFQECEVEEDVLEDQVYHGLFLVLEGQHVNHMIYQPLHYS